MQIDPANILEPLDPLNISFSADKCVHTPTTDRTQKVARTPATPPQGRELRSNFSMSERVSSRSKYSAPVDKLYSKYVSTTPRTRFSSLSRKEDLKMGQKIHVKPFTLGNSLLEQGLHLKEIKKLDLLINKVNARIQIGRKALRF